MNTKYKKTVLGLGCILVSACSSLEQFGLGDFNSIPTSIPSAEDVKGNLNNSRLEGAMNLAKAATLSNEEVMQYAKSFSKIKDGKNKIAAANSPYSIRLNNLVKNHLKEEGLALNYKVYLSPQVNAFSMADGTVRVYSGLMDKMKDDELLFVIGHEIGHVKHEHSKDKLQKAYATRALISTGASELSAKTGASAMGGLQRIGLDKAEQITEDLVNAQFSQSDEKEADDYGLTFTKKHGITSDAGVRALRKLAALNEKESSLVEGLFSSHPDSEERAKRLESQIGTVSNEKAEAGQTVKAELPADNTDTVEEKPSYGSMRVVTQEDATAETENAMPATYRWYVQVEAAPDKAKAEETLANFESSGFKGEIQEAIVNGSIYYRVLLGSFANSAQAKAQMFDIQNTGLSDGQPFLQKLEAK